jgi:hypothetical protein
VPNTEKSQYSERGARPLNVAYFEKHVLIASPKPIDCYSKTRRDLAEQDHVIGHAAILALAAIAGNAKPDAKCEAFFRFEPGPRERRGREIASP